MACIWSFVERIQLKILHAILQWTNKDTVIIFTPMRERHLRLCPDV